VPGGERSIIVAYGIIATEEVLIVEPGEENSLGTVVVPTELLTYVEE
jgi:hypothetical protein